jgi:hypothetical protein
LSTFNTKYGTANTRLDVCTTCHGTGGNSTWNSYGQALRTRWLSSGQVSNTELTALEPVDSDGDTFTNIVEINARFFPGDANDHPAATAGAMSVAPATGLTSSGTVGGPFSPSSVLYTLTNTGGASINWSAAKTQTWVTLSSASGSLAAGATATVTASIGTGANSLAAGSYNDTVTFTNTTNGTGNTTRPVSLTVTTTPDATAPTVSSTVPGINETGLAVAAVSATFSEAIAPASVTTSSFTLKRGVDSVAGTVSVNGAVATFTPSAALAENTTYTATLTTAVTDVAGNHLAADYVWTFTTAVAAPPAGDAGGGCAMVGSRGGIKEIFGAYGALVLVGLGIGLRRRRKEK